MKKLYPSLYQVNTRVWLSQLSRELKRKATLDDIPDKELSRIADQGFTWIWFLSVWTTGKKGRNISRTYQGWRKGFEETLADLHEEDIGGSGFAIADYSVSSEMGGAPALKRLRDRLHSFGLKLMLDFVPNHMGPDHKWLSVHPDYFIQGTKSDLKSNPQNFTFIENGGSGIFAYGRDPYFSGWPDTVQLDYSNRETAIAMTSELVRISDQCDGLRCDMAMLILPETFHKTWGRTAVSFWPEAISQVKGQNQDFCFLAEVYWDMEWQMQLLGFDYAYDKRLYDRLHDGCAKDVREHFYAGMEYQNKLARFLENHDEQRAAEAFPFDKHQASAVITYLSPGMRFFHQGQVEGRKKHISPHLIRAPHEEINFEIQNFYTNLLNVINKPLYYKGHWRLVDCSQAWEGNGSYDSFIVFSWEDVTGSKGLVAVNFSEHDSQCYVHIRFEGMNDKSIRLIDQMSQTVYERNGNDILSAGLFLDLQPWGYHVFNCITGS